MAFFLSVIYLALFFISPAELFPSLAPYRIMLLIGILSIVITVLGLAVGKRPTFRAPQNYLMIGFVASIVMSQIAQGWFGGGLLAFSSFGVSATIFMLVVINATSLSRIRAIAGTLIFCSLFLTLMGALGVHYGFSGDTSFVHREDVAANQSEQESLQGMATGAETVETRIHSLGVLNDPNDFAQLLIIPLPLLALGWRRGRLLWNCFFIMIPFLFLIYGIYLTRSRGGFISLLILGLLGLRLRLNRGLATAMMVSVGALLLALNFTGGRDIALDASVRGRLDAWGGGLQMAKSSPLFGMGYGNFTEYFERTAHNAFILCFAELGFIGYFFWLALIVTTILELRALKHLRNEYSLSPEVSRWSTALRLSLYSFLVGSLFLSRTYTPTFYLLLGLCVALVELVRREYQIPVSLPLSYWSVRVVALEVSSIGCFYLLMRFYNIV